jgi:oligopeptide transport system substrate-binding protein
MLRLLVIPTCLVALLAASILLWKSPADPRADFTFILRGDNKCLDPNGMSWMQDIRLAYGLWEGLYTLDPATLKPIPGCADEIGIDATKTIYTFHIRDNARWSNGDPVLAGDFVFAWRRMLETPGDYTYLFHYIRGAQEYESQYAQKVAEAAKTAGDQQPAPIGPMPDFAAVGIETPDRKTIRVTLKEPIPFFPALCAFPSFFPLNERSMWNPALHNTIVDKRTGQVTFDQHFTRPPYLISNGPYYLADWTFKRRLRMIANDYYWDRQHVRSRVIDQIYFDEPMAAYRTYNDGTADWLSDVDPDLAAAILRRGDRPDLHMFSGFGTYYFEFNCLPKLPDGRTNPLYDSRVRRALSMAIDKQSIIDEVGRLHQPLATTYIPPGIFDGYTSPKGLPFDIAAAKKLLAEAGYPGGRGFGRLTILYNTEGMHGDIAKMLHRQWQLNLGIDMDLSGLEIKTFGERLHSQQYDIARASWIGDYDDPTTFTDKYRSDADGNDAKWKNADYDRLCAAAETETDPAKRMNLLSDAEAILLQDAPILPIYVYVNCYMYRANVSGIPLNPKNMVILKSATAGR